MSGMQKLKFPLFFAVILTTIVGGLPFLGKALVQGFGWRSISRDIGRGADTLQHFLCWPWERFTSGLLFNIGIAFCWFFLLGVVLRTLHIRVLRGRYRWVVGGIMVVCITLRLFPGIVMLGENKIPSQSKGKVYRGSLQQGKRMPYQGANFTGYSFLGYLGGRTFVHSDVRKVVLEAYAEMEQIAPQQHFVLMETGRRFGGRFSPHRTHQNGLSVDFMTPMLQAGEPYVSSQVYNLWGYHRTFDAQGNITDTEIRIDYGVMAQHLRVLHRVAQKHGLRIQKVIFDPVLQAHLFSHPEGKGLKALLPFTRNRVAFRHDDHYHVDFGL